MNPIQTHNVKARSNHVAPEVHETPEARRLKESCQQFESILWAQVWKKMRTTAQKISASDKDRPWKQMEDLSIEMASEDLLKNGGAGLWKVLYDQMVGTLVRAETQEPSDDA